MTYFLVILIWLLISYIVARFVGAAIREAEATDVRGQATGVGAVYLQMDKHIEVLGHDTVLQWLDPSIVDDFNGKNEARRVEEERKERFREARRKHYEARIAQSADPIQTKRQIVSEILGTDPDYSQARIQVQDALGRTYSVPRERVEVASFDGNQSRW